jgi:hypothetical protein
VRRLNCVPLLAMAVERKKKKEKKGCCCCPVYDQSLQPAWFRGQRMSCAWMCGVMHP